MISTLRSQWPEPSPRPRSCPDVAQARRGVWYGGASCGRAGRELGGRTVLVTRGTQRTRRMASNTTPSLHSTRHNSLYSLRTLLHYTRAAAAASRAASRAWNARLCTARASAASASGSTVGAAAAAATCRCKLARRGPTVLMSMGVKPSFTMAGEVAASCVQSLPCTPPAPHAGQAL